MHVLVMALNFWHDDFAFPELHALQRTPNEKQANMLDYLHRIVSAFGGVEETVVSSAGRRSLQLVARLDELSRLLTNLGSVGDNYAHVPEGLAVPTDNAAAPGLDPYLSLTAGRLKLVGTGFWDPTPYLSDELYMAYVEALSLLCDTLPDEDSYPDCARESRSQTLELARLWDRLGLLHLEPFEELPMHQHTRIFNCFKSDTHDQQIGDRRGVNATEAKVLGPSRHVPTGELLCSLSVCPRVEGLCVAAADRRDSTTSLGDPATGCY